MERIKIIENGFCLKQKGKIPETMPAVENYKKVAALTKQEDEAGCSYCCF